MKKYTKPTVEVVELSVKESLSALPSAFGGIGGDKTGFSFKMGALSGATRKNVSVYTFNSKATTNS